MALVLLGTSLIVALLLIFGLADDGELPSSGRLVTVEEAEPLSPGAYEASLIGGNVGQSHVGRALGTGLKLRPKAVQGETIGYVIEAASSASALEFARLRAGDILTSVDDRPLDDTRIRNLGEELSTHDRVEIRFERNGWPRKRTLDLRR